MTTNEPAKKIDKTDARRILEDIKAKDTPENRLKEKDATIKSLEIGTVVLLIIILGLIAFISYR